ncbi:MAG: hypothetical protein ACTSW3_07210 [Promethearchaeota archaeon]
MINSKEIINKPVEIIENKGIKPIKDHQITLKENVRDILNNNNLALRNDLILYLEYLKLTNQAIVNEEDGNIKIIIPKNRIIHITLPESISRCRRILHQRGEIHYPESLEKSREKHQIEFKEQYPHSYENEFEEKENMGIF